MSRAQDKTFYESVSSAVLIAVSTCELTIFLSQGETPTRDEAPVKFI